MGVYPGGGVSGHRELVADVAPAAAVRGDSVTPSEALIGTVNVAPSKAVIWRKIAPTKAIIGSAAVTGEWISIPAGIGVVIVL